MKLYVGNLSAKTSEDQLRKEFTKYGKVGNISLNPKPIENAYRFCFVEMPFENQAIIAIRELDGKTIGGQIINIKESGLSG